MAFQPTVPRGPVGGMFSSPGPIYKLPGLIGQRDHDIRSGHGKAPAYLFGNRIAEKRDTAGPGPCYNFQNQKVYRNGKDGAPHYSLYRRPKDKREFVNPAANRYYAENTFGISKPSAPKYSFRPKLDKYRTDNTPAANSYKLPSLTGRTIEANKKQAPIYSMRGRSNVGNFAEDMAKTPAPCTYKIRSYYSYLRRPPAYTLHDRTNVPIDYGEKPGPNIYSPEKSWPHKKRAPGYSFGIRHSEFVAPLIQPMED